MEPIPASVLVIESHPMMREALCNAIASEVDLEIAQLATGDAEAIQIVLSLQPDTIFLAHRPDIVLFALGNPGLEELEALRTLREFLPDTPILALTSNEVPGQEQAALVAGADVVLTKAAPRAELIRTLRELQGKAFLHHSENPLEEARQETSP